MNIECVSKFGGWAYYRKPKSEWNFELFSDATSKISYLKSMNRFFILVLLFNVMIGIYNVVLGLLEPAAGLLSIRTGCISFLVALLMVVPIVKIGNRKKGLKQDLHIFEG